MTSWGDLHGEAMDLSDRALRHQRRGEHGAALSLFERALELEREALSLMGEIGEPIYSTMYRSAATLALDCKEYRLAERLASRALAGEPPGYLVRELREVVEQANSREHLRIEGIELTSHEFQMSISGGSVAPGEVLIEDWLPRLEGVSALIQRVWQWTSGRSHSETSSPTAGPEKLKLALSPLRQGSMAVTIKVGMPSQLSFPGMLQAESIIGKTLDVVETVAIADDDLLATTYEDEAYRRNFVGLVKKVAPDGEHVTQVGFTTVAAGNERQVPLRRKKSEITTPKLRSPETQQKTITGRLLLADGTAKATKAISVVQADGSRRRIRVPAGMMDDIVRPYWNEMVTAECMVKGKTATLVGIEGV